MPLKLRATVGGTMAPVYVHPRAKDERIVANEEIEVYTREPAEGSRANTAVVRLLSDAIGVPRRNISIVRGSTSRLKEVHIAGLAPDRIEQSLRKGAIEKV